MVEVLKQRDELTEAGDRLAEAEATNAALIERLERAIQDR
jgi:hypothetical protein